jgi:hypothetical protein
MGISSLGHEWGYLRAWRGGALVHDGDAVDKYGVYPDVGGAAASRRIMLPADTGASKNIGV